MAGGLIDNITNFISGGAYNDARDAAQEGVEEFKKLQLPSAEELKVQLSKLVDEGKMSPEKAQAVLAESTAMENISLDPRLKQAQMDALASLQEIGQGGGLTAMDKAQLADIQAEEDRASRGAREAILQNAQARGMGGSGLEMLSQMKNQQDAATRQSARDTSVAGMAQQRALQALQSAGQLGGQIGNQDFAQQAQIAQAKDAINQFNAQNKNQFALANTQAANDAQKFNLQKQLEVNKINTDIKNQQQTANAGAVQQAAQNQLNKASGIAGAQQNVSQASQARGAANTGLVGSLIQGGATVAAGKSDKNAKENIEDFDASAFLDSITPSKYNYKNPAQDGYGKHVGVMAQDVEKEVPQLVEDTPDGKVIDYNKAGGPIFASLADLHDRIKKLEGVG